MTKEDVKMISLRDFRWETGIAPDWARQYLKEGIIKGEKNPKNDYWLIPETEVKRIMDLVALRAERQAALDACTDKKKKEELKKLVNEIPKIKIYKSKGLLPLT